jgi:hypothetical protein
VRIPVREIVLIVLVAFAFPFLSSSWSFILACFGRVVGPFVRMTGVCGHSAVAAWIGVIRQTVIEVSV